MNGLLQYWAALAARQKMMLVTGLLTFGVVFFLIAKMAMSPNYTLLYAGLENSASGDVVNVLEQQKIPYQIRGDSIFVDQTARDQLRMTLAAEGLPKTGTQGYEILDNLSGFGTTSQMFDAAYWRAKEGELARTISSHPNVVSARVHISNSSNILTRGRNPVKASIALTTNNGLSPQHAKALRYLVSSAVSGLNVSNVAVIDDENGLILDGDIAGAANTTDQRATILKNRVERLLEARVGYGSAIVEVNVEADLDQESIVERLFDPKGRVAVSTQSVETNKSSNDTGSPPVGVASNVPDAENGNGAGSQSTDNETRETVNYEISETQREIVKAPGAIKRLSIAVLIDKNDLVLNENTSVEEELNALRDLVASAVGFDSERGDSLTLKTLEFKPIADGIDPPAPRLFSGQKIDLTQIIQIGALVFVALITALFVLRPLLQKTSPVKEARAQKIEDFQENSQQLLMSQSNDQTSERLRALIGEKQDETIDILKSWLDDSREKTT